MKKIEMISMSFLLGLFLMLSPSLYAQGALKPTPGVINKVILENEEVRVLEITFAPGAITDWHSHPNHVVYALTDGEMEITDKGKAPKVISLKAGTAMYLPAVTHIAKNVGTATVKMIVTELKPASSGKY